MNTVLRLDRDLDKERMKLSLTSTCQQPEMCRLKEIRYCLPLPGQRRFWQCEQALAFSCPQGFKLGIRQNTTYVYVHIWIFEQQLEMFGPPDILLRQEPA